MRFGTFELDSHNGELRRGGILIKLTPQQLKLLHFLVDNPGQILTREQIQREIWGTDTFVDFDRNLNVCVAQLRAALNDDSEAPRFIQTIPRRGYRFVAPVVIAEQPKAEPPRKSRRSLVIIAAAILCGILSSYFVLYQVALHRRAAHGDIRLAVLPFENLSGDPNDNPAVDGLTDELITQFGSIQPTRLGVIGRSSVMRYKSARPGLDQIGRDLGVDYVVEGTLRRGGSRARITSRLVRVADQVQVWTETFEQDEANLFQMQEDASARITAAVLGDLFPGITAAAKPAHAHPRKAYQAYLNGRYLQRKGNRTGLQRSILSFEEAIMSDPSFSEAHAAMAETYVALGRSGSAGREDFPRAKLAAETALRLDDGNAEAHNALANALFWRDWNWPEAERHFSRAIGINPSYALGYHDYAFFQVAMGRTEDGLSSLRRALALDPLSTRVNIDAGWLLLQAHRFDDAIKQARRALELEPGLEEANACIARALQYQGRSVSSIAGKPGADEPFFYATACALRSENVKALDSLDRAYAAHSTMMPLLKTEPAFAKLHVETRFQELLQKMRFP